MLTGSMFCLFFLLYFRLMAECEVEGPLWVVLGRSRGLCVRSWVALGASAGGLGSLLGPLWAVLGSSWALCGRSWVALGASAGDLGPLLGLCRRSWAALGAFVGDLGPLLGPLLAVVGRLGPKSGPNPCGKAIWACKLAGWQAAFESLTSGPSVR